MMKAVVSNVTSEMRSSIFRIGIEKQLAISKGDSHTMDVLNILENQMCDWRDVLEAISTNKQS